MEQFTVRFHVGPFPVVIAPFFWLTMVFYGLYLSDRGRPVELVLATLVVIAGSILVHELAHAAMYRAYDQQPVAILHGLGGLTYGQRPLSASEQIVVSVAGPLSQIMLLGIPFWVINRLYDGGWRTEAILYDITWFNIVWGLINLLPALPLDGGHIAQAATVLVTGQPHRRRIHQLSIGVGIAGMVYCITANWWLGTTLALWIIILNAMALYSPATQTLEMGASDYRGSSGWDAPEPTPTRRRGRKGRAKRRFGTKRDGKPAERLAAGYDLLERHDPAAARAQVAPLLGPKSKGNKRERGHAAVIAAWAHLREGSPAQATIVLGTSDSTDASRLVRQVAEHVEGQRPLNDLAAPISASMNSVDVRRDARQALEVLVRRDEAIPLAHAMLATMDLDGVLKLQQTLHDMGRRSLANEVSNLLLADPDS